MVEKRVIGNVTFNVTPKCGIITYGYYSRKYNDKIKACKRNLQVIISRNPYNRLISFYINKIVAFKGNPDNKAEEGESADGENREDDSKDLDEPKTPLGEEPDLKVSDDYTEPSGGLIPDDY